MRRIMLIGVIVLTVLCSAGVLAAVWSSSPRAPIIYALPLYPNARNVVYKGPEAYVAASSARLVAGTNAQIGQSSNPARPSFDPKNSVLSFETTASPQTVAGYYSGWFMSGGWTSQTYGQAQAQVTSQFTTYSRDGSPDPARVEVLGLNGIIPKLYIPFSHLRVYVSAHLLSGVTLVEIRVYNMEY